MEIQIVFLLVLIRISAVVFTAPIFRSHFLPWRFRLILSALISLSATPLIADATTAALPNSIESFFSAAMSEIVIGTLLGLGVSLMLAAAQMAGYVIAQMAGVQWPTLSGADSNDQHSPVSLLFAMISIAAFVLIGGPELVIGSTIDTFTQLPVGSSLQTSDAVSLLIELLRQSFLLTLRGASPAIASLLVSTIVIGLISRTYPRMNMLGIALTSNQLVLFLAIFLTLGSSVWLFVDDIGFVMQGMFES